jgi:hypothetical protein
MKQRFKKKNYVKYASGQFELLNVDKDSIVMFRFDPNKYTYVQVYDTYKLIKRVIEKHGDNDLLAVPSDVSLKLFDRKQLINLRNHINDVLEGTSGKNLH